MILFKESYRIKGKASEKKTAKGSRPKRRVSVTARAAAERKPIMISFPFELRELPRHRGWLGEALRFHRPAGS